MTATDPIDFLLDSTGDIVVTTDVQMVSGVAAVTQAIRVRLLTFKGEWSLDLDHGFPWFQEVFGAKYQPDRIRSLVRAFILETPNVLDVLSLDVTFNGATRELTVTFAVNTVFGVSATTTVTQ